MDAKKKNRIVFILSNLIWWTILFFVPAIMQLLNGNSKIVWFDYTWGTIFISNFFIFYLNYFLLIDHVLFRHRLFLFIIINVCYNIVAGQLIALFYPEMNVWSSAFPVQDVGARLVVILMSFTIEFFFVGMSVMVKLSQRWYKEEVERREEEKHKTESELIWLKNQLNPHFLFNTLNNIFSLVSHHPNDAQDAIRRLSEMLRYVLYDSSAPLVSLDDELNFIRNYVELMKLRLSERTEVSVDLPEDGEGITIVPLLYISLIENAFKHGVNSSMDSFVHIRLEHRTHDLYFTIVNSYFPKTESDKSGSGIGLENLKKRLLLCYPNQYSFHYGREGEEYKSELIIQIPKTAKQ